MWVLRLKTPLRYQSDFMGSKKKLDLIISLMVNYFRVPRQQEPIVSCVDACIRLIWGQPFKQIAHGAHNNCYIRIPAQVTHRFSEDDERRQDLFIATCFWNKMGIPPRVLHYVDLCYTCLALAGTGERLPSVALALVGHEGKWQD